MTPERSILTGRVRTAFIKAKRPLTIREVAARLDRPHWPITPQSAGYHVRKLERAGEIVRVGRGWVKVREDR